MQVHFVKILHKILPTFVPNKRYTHKAPHSCQQQTKSICKPSTKFIHHKPKGDMCWYFQYSQQESIQVEISY